jgi:molybdenum cofactor guanylyltransferase
MKIAAVIIAGGSSTRMGRNKALIDLAGRPVLQWVVDRISPQVDGLAINANSSLMDHFGLPIVSDVRHGIGTPLAGVHAGLCWARNAGFDTLLTVPADSPFVPCDLVAKLGAGAPVIAASAGQVHYLTGLWPVSQLQALEQSNFRRVQDWAKHCHARTIEWPAEPYDPFFNINTPEDLARAEVIAAQFIR